MLDAKQILIYLSIKCGGDWNEIYKCIKTHAKFDKELILNTVKKLKCGAITILDDDYPENLKRIPYPPIVLFYYGDISLIKDYKSILAVVGSRDPLQEIIDPTTYIISRLSERYTIVSGLANGIDTIAHQSALKQGGKTIAVLGNGIDYVYPKENIDLYNEIKEKGLIISEYPGNTVPEKSFFPFRNRIIAALAKGMFIPNINYLSGTYSSLRYALQFGSEIFVLPHPPLSKTANNKLIFEGATIASDEDDIFVVMG